MGIICQEEKKQLKQIKTVNMKKEIKSFYIIKEILSYLKEKKKLDLIIYNKSIQKLMGYNIDYYKNISQKYKVADKNGKGKSFYYSIKQN